MREFTIGDTIRKARIANGFRQGKVANGICANATFSKIENDIIIPSKSKLDCILQRLGMNPERYVFYVTPREKELYRLYSCFKNQNEDKTNQEELIERIFQYTRMNDSVEMQMAKSIQIKFLYEQQKIEPMEAYKRYEDTLKLTVPHLNEHLFQKFLFSKNEWKLLLNMMQMLMRSGELRKALELGFELKEYFEQEFIEDSLKAEEQELLLIKITEILQALQRYEEALEISNLIMELAYKRKNFENITEVMINRTLLYGKLNVERKSVTKLMIQTIAIIRMLHMETSILHFVNYMQEEFNINIDSNVVIE